MVSPLMNWNDAVLKQTAKSKYKIYSTHLLFYTISIHLTLVGHISCCFFSSSIRLNLHLARNRCIQNIEFPPQKCLFGNECNHWVWQNMPDIDTKLIPTNKPIHQELMWFFFWNSFCLLFIFNLTNETNSYPIITKKNTQTCKWTFLQSLQSTASNKNKFISHPFSSTRSIPFSFFFLNFNTSASNILFNWKKIPLYQENEKENVSAQMHPGFFKLAIFGHYLFFCCYLFFFIFCSVNVLLIYNFSFNTQLQ